MDPTGARFAIASMDSSLKLYDFAGYNLLDPVPFFNGIVEDGYPILSMAYSSDGSSILIGTGSSQCKVFDRDGQELVKFVRGDVYVRDPSKTIGHTAAVTSVGWHPLHKSIVFTTSRDGSMRSWNINKGKFSFGMLNCSDVVVIKHLRTGRKTIPTCLAVSTNTLAIGTECGSIQIYKYPLVSKLRPQQSVQASPAQLGSKDGYSIVSLVYSVDETKLAVRTKKEVTVWNTASRLSTSTPPWMKFVNLPLHDDDVNSSTPTMAFSPNGKVLCIATSTRDENNSRIVRSSLEICIIPKEAQNLENNIPPSPIYSLPVLDTDTGHSILSLFWHQKLNQILVTTPKGFQIWYSTDWSKKGILLTSSRRRKRKNVEDELQDIYKSRAPPPGTAIRHEEIITPNSLPLFSTDKPRGSKKQRSEEEHRESVAQRIPQKPSKDIYNTSDIMFKQMISDGNSSKQKIIAGKDPREALAEYNEGKSYIGQAYEGNIERILTTKTIEQEMDEMNNKKK
jgi:WD40 repeat protein